MSGTTKWGSIRVRQDLIDRVAKALHTEEAQRDGFTNVSQYTDHVLREAVSDLESKRFEHVNMYDDHVKILDNRVGRQGRILSVYFRRDTNPMCDYCEESDCVHVQYAWEIDGVRRMLEQHGLRPPSSRV